MPSARRVARPAPQPTGTAPVSIPRPTVADDDGLRTSKHPMGARRRARRPAAPRPANAQRARAARAPETQRRPHHPNPSDQPAQRCMPTPPAARLAATPSELVCRTEPPHLRTPAPPRLRTRTPLRRAFALRAAASTRRNASPRRKNRSSCTFFEVRCTNAPVSGRFPSSRPARTCERSGEQCDDLRFYETDRREGDGGGARSARRSATNLKKCARNGLLPTRGQRTSKNVQPSA